MPNSEPGHDKAVPDRATPPSIPIAIDRIDSHRVDLRAAPSLTEHCAARVDDRLDSLVAAGWHRIRIDFASTTDIDPTVAAAFRRTAAELAAIGGELEVTHLDRSLQGMLGVTDDIP